MEEFIMGKVKAWIMDLEDEFIDNVIGTVNP